MSIQVSLDGLSFCILNTENRKIVFYKKLKFDQQLDPIKTLGQIELEYEKEEALRQEIGEVKILFSNHLYSLVPSQYFREENMSNYLKFNTRILKTDFIAHDELEKQAIVNVYIPYTNIINYFFEKYGEFEYKHNISVFLESILNLPKQPRPQMYVNAQEAAFDLGVIENGELLLCNSFTYDTKEDFLYYILFTAEQLNLNPEWFELFLLGEITEDSPLFRICYKYIRQVKLAENFTTFDFAPGTEKPRLKTENFILMQSL